MLAPYTQAVNVFWVKGEGEMSSWVTRVEMMLVGVVLILLLVLTQAPLGRHG
jgi:hypothetical protein